MSKNDQDGIASVPRWYRRWITKRYGASTMALLDRVGKHHDEDIVRYGHKVANGRMRKKIRRLKLPYWGIRLPIGVMIGVYRQSPRWLKQIYWRLLK